MDQHRASEARRDARGQLTIDVEVSDARVVIRVAGELERANVDAFLADARPPSRLSGLEIDLRGTTFMDLGGIRALEHVVAVANPLSVPVGITRVDRNVLRILDIACGHALRSRIQRA